VAKFIPLYGPRNLMSSTKQEVGLHNISQRRRRRTEPRPYATCTKNW